MFSMSETNDKTAAARVVRSGEGESYDPTWVFKHGSLTGAPFDFMIGAVAYLGGPPLQVHAEAHDAFYVLEGVLAFQIGDEVFDLLPGDFVSAPPGVAHTFDNIREDQPPVKVCNVMTPGGLDAFFAALSRGEAARPAAQGATFVGPTIGEKLGLIQQSPWMAGWSAPTGSGGRA
jgi:quercetin dioxygenase-like cupin family protein